MRKTVLTIAALALWLGAGAAEASHFRYGQITWKRVVGTTVEFTVTSAWRCDLPGFGETRLSFSDGTSSETPDLQTNTRLVTTGRDCEGNCYEIYVFKTTHTFPNEGPFTASFESCCRISNLANAGGASERVETVVDLRGGNQGSPSSSIPVIVAFSKGLNKLLLPVSDPDGDPITCRMATAAESKIPSVASVASGTLSVSAGCELQWDSTAANVGDKFAVQVAVEENHGGNVSSSALDFIVEICGGNRPGCTASATGTQSIPSGQPFTATFTGTDPDGQNLSLSTFGLPPFCTLTPAAGTSQPGPFQAQVQCTPATADEGGSFPFNVVFTDTNGLQGVCPLALRVTPKRCLVVRNEKLLCRAPGSPGYTYSFEVVNDTGDDLHHLFLTRPTPPGVISVLPDYFNLSIQPSPPPASPLPRPVPPGVSSGPLTVNILGGGAQPGTQIPFVLSAHDAQLDHCCSITKVLTLPRCDCAQVVSSTPACRNFSLPGQPPSFSTSFTLQNLTNDNVAHVLVAPSNPPNLTIRPSQFAVSLPNRGDTTASLPVTVSGPGALSGQACFRISIHTASFEECCSIEHCVNGVPGFCPLVADGRFPHTGLGNASVVVFDEEIAVTRIGRGGEDGVRIGLGQALGFTAVWRDFDPAGTVENGSFLEVSATGSVAGRPDRRIGAVRIEDAGAAIEASVSLAELGVTTYRVEVFDDGELAHTTEARGPVEIETGDWPSSAGFETSGEDRRGAVTLGLADALWKIQGGPAVSGDRVRVTATNGSAVDSLSAIEILAAGIPALVIVDEQVTLAGEAPDLLLALNTGFDQAAGTTLPLGTLPAGTPDEDWQLADGTPARLVIGRLASWPAPLPNSEWISMNPDRGRSPRGVSKLSYESCFCLGPQATAAELDLQLRADDSAEVFLNGVRIGGPGGSFSGPPLSVRFNGAVRTGGPFVVGENCLRVDVSDPGRVVTGLNLAGTVRAPGGACGSN